MHKENSICLQEVEWEIAGTGEIDQAFSTFQSKGFELSSGAWDQGFRSGEVGFEIVLEE